MRRLLLHFAVLWGMPRAIDTDLQDIASGAEINGQDWCSSKDQV